MEQEKKLLVLMNHISIRVALREHRSREVSRYDGRLGALKDAVGVLVFCAAAVLSRRRARRAKNRGVKPGAQRLGTDATPRRTAQEFQRRTRAG